MHRNDIPLTSPCPLAAPDQAKAIQRDSAGGVWCTHCNATVHDLSALGPEAAQAMVQRGGVCVRAPLRRDGRVAWKTRRSGSVSLKAGLLVAAMVGAPAVASLSKEPGASVSLLDWVWAQVEEVFAEPATAGHSRCRGIAPELIRQIEEQMKANAIQEPHIPRDPIAIIPAEPYNPIGRRDPFHSPVTSIGGGITAGGFPPALPPAVSQPHTVVVSSSPSPPDSWPPGVPIHLQAAPPPPPDATPHTVHGGRTDGAQSDGPPRDRSGPPPSQTR